MPAAGADQLSFELVCTKAHNVCPEQDIGGVPMKALFLIGVLLVVLGIVSLFVPIPRKEDKGIQAGDVKIGVQVEHNERVAPIISAVLIVVGGGLMIAGRKRTGA
jgi:hypothetical protein